MNTTDDLIVRLGAELSPVKSGGTARRLAAGLAAGAVLSAVLVGAWLGLRPDLAAAITTGPFWMKFVYTLALAGLGFWLAERAARPGVALGGLPALAGGLILAMVLVGLGLLAAAPGADRAPMLLGSSYRVCPWLIAVVSTPTFAGAVWAMRGAAPTRPTLAGACAGLLAGGAGAWIYAFHCPEVAEPFLAVFYTGGVLLVTAAGAIVGRFALRW
jgi:hypothetical protein